MQILGTHNSFINLEQDIGVEEEYLHALLAQVYQANESQVVIADQRYSVLDQLNSVPQHALDLF